MKSSTTKSFGIKHYSSISLDWLSEKSMKESKSCPSASVLISLLGKKRLISFKSSAIRSKIYTSSIRF